MNTDEQINQVDIHIEAVELAIQKVMSVVEKEDLVKSVISLQQQRRKLLEKNNQ